MVGTSLRVGRGRVAIGEVDGLPVATGYSLLCDGDAGLSVYIGGIAVLPAARRKGIGLHCRAGSWVMASNPVQVRPSPDRFKDAARVYERLGLSEFGASTSTEENERRSCHCLRSGCGAV